MRDRPTPVFAFTTGIIMASQDMKSAEKMYDSFIASLKWTVPLIAAITLVVVILIAD